MKILQNNLYLGMLSLVGVFNSRRYNLAFVLVDFKISCVIQGSRFIWFRLRVIVLAEKIGLLFPEINYMPYVRNWMR